MNEADAAVAGRDLPSWLRLLAGPVRPILRDRELFTQLLKRDIQSSVRGSVLGMAWILITPLVLVAIYTFVFGVILKSAWASATESPLVVPLIYFTGLVTFSFFMEVVTRSPEYIRGNRTYVTKIVFPIEILSWVLVGTSGVKFLASLAMLTVFMILVKGGLPALMMYLPVVLLPLIVTAVGLSWYLSAIGTYARDLNQLLMALGPVLMFVSPIFYSVDQVPESIRPVFWFNPLTFVLETLRGLLYFDRVVDWTAYGLYWVGAIFVFYSGYAFFQRARRGFADVV